MNIYNISGKLLVDNNLANLAGANLTWANLYEANFRRADLTKANLYGAELIGADLTKANLSGACLRRADLANANFTKANLTGADLTGADLCWTIGNLYEICTLLLETYPISFTSEVLQIGCKNYKHRQWIEFTDDEINIMDVNALAFWKKYKSFIFHAINLKFGTDYVA